MKKLYFGKQEDHTSKTTHPLPFVGMKKLPLKRVLKNLPKSVLIVVETDDNYTVASYQQNI